MLEQRDGGNLDDDVIDAELQIGIEFVDAAAHFHDAVHLDLGAREEIQHRANGGEQPLRDHFTHLTDWLIAKSGGACNLCTNESRGRFSSGDGHGGRTPAHGRFNVTFNNPSTWSATTQRTKV